MVELLFRVLLAPLIIMILIMGLIKYLLFGDVDELLEGLIIWRTSDHDDDLNPDPQILIPILFGSSQPGQDRILDL